MAIIKLNYLSKALLRTVDVTVVLPTDTLDMDTMTYNQKKEYKTLYLLHGIFGDQNDWLYGTRIQRFASERGLCVVMPSGENMFYVDQENTHNLYSQCSLFLIEKKILLLLVFQWEAMVLLSMV